MEYDILFKIINITLGLLCLAWMDFINFQFKPDTGYFSLHTKGSKRDAWHDGKKCAIFFFALAALGEGAVIQIIESPLFWVAILAIVCQWFYHILKWIKLTFNKE